MGSEKEQRKLSKQLITTEITGHTAPFTHALKSGGEEVKEEAMAYIPMVEEKLIELLEQRRRYVQKQLHNQILNTHTAHHSCNQLTWHNGAIPEDEIWVKLGGDKGGGTFKMNFQVCNVLHPNSPANTCVFCIFVAYDSVTNLHIGLDRYTEEISLLQKKKWMYTLNNNSCQ